MNSFRTLLAIFFVLFLSPVLSLADTLELKSGKVIEGQITEQSSDAVKIDAGVGVTVTYYRDEIEKVNGQPFSPESVTGENLDKDSSQVAAPKENFEKQNALPPSTPEAAVEPIQEDSSQTKSIVSDSPKTNSTPGKPTLQLKPDAPELDEEETLPVVNEIPEPVPAPAVVTAERVEIPPEKKEVSVPTIVVSKRSSDLEKYLPKGMESLPDILSIASQRNGPERIVAKFLECYLFVIFLIALGFIIYGVAFFRIARNLSDPSPSQAFMPVVQWFLLMRLAGWPVVLVLALFIPIVGDFVQMFAWMKISQRLNRPAWLGFLMPVWVLNLIIIWSLATSSAPVKIEKISPEEFKS